MPVNNPIYMVCSQSWPNNPDCEIHGTKPALLAGSKHSRRLQGQSRYIELLFWTKPDIHYPALLDPFLVLLGPFLSFFGQFHYKMKIYASAGSEPL